MLKPFHASGRLVSKQLVIFYLSGLWVPGQAEKKGICMLIADLDDVSNLIVKYSVP